MLHTNAKVVPSALRVMLNVPVQAVVRDELAVRTGSCNLFIKELLCICDFFLNLTKSLKKTEKVASRSG